MLRKLWLVPLLMVACGDDDRPIGPRVDAGTGSLDAGPCTEGQILCTGRERFVCTGGVPVSQELCEEACAPGIGCTACVPGLLFCEGQEIRRCAADGQSSTIER